MALRTGVLEVSDRKKKSGRATCHNRRVAHALLDFLKAKILIKNVRAKAS